MPNIFVEDLPAVSVLDDSDVFYVVHWDSALGKWIDQHGTIADIRAAVELDTLANVAGLIRNISIVASCASNALTISLKQKDGVTDHGTLGSRGQLSFRSAPVTDPSFSVLDIETPLSTVISSGSTAGHVASKDEYVYVYVLNNSGSLELAWSSSFHFDETQLQDTTAEGGSGTADNRITLYSTTARTGVPVRLIGRFRIQQATPGTWVTNPSRYDLAPFARKQMRNYVYCDTANGHGSTNNKIRRYTNAVTVGDAITRSTSAANGDSFTINEDGLYSISLIDGAAGVSIHTGVSVNSNQLTTSILTITAINKLFETQFVSTSASPGGLSFIERLYVGDVVRVHDDGTADFTTVCRFRISKIAE